MHYQTWLDPFIHFACSSLLILSDKGSRNALSFLLSNKMCMVYFCFWTGLNAIVQIDWPQMHPDIPALTSQVLGLQTYTTTPGYIPCKQTNKQQKTRILLYSSGWL